VGIIEVKLFVQLNPSAGLIIHGLQQHTSENNCT
jgi:hypothetical protein